MNWSSLLPYREYHYKTKLKPDVIREKFKYVVRDKVPLFGYKKGKPFYGKIKGNNFSLRRIWIGQGNPFYIRVEIKENENHSDIIIKAGRKISPIPIIAFLGLIGFYKSDAFFLAVELLILIYIFIMAPFMFNILFTEITFDKLFPKEL